MAGGRTCVIFRQILSLFNGSARIRTSNIVKDGRTAYLSQCSSYTGLGDSSLRPQRSLHTSLRSSQRFQNFSTAAQIHKEIDVHTEPREPSESDNEQNKALIERVNSSIVNPDVGRLFAVVHIKGLQRKVTTEDVIIVMGDFPPTVGEKIRLEKVLMVGGADFSLVGKPLLSRDVVKVEATVIEKTLSNFRVNFSYRKRSRKSRRFKVKRDLQTMLLINSIELQNIKTNSEKDRQQSVDSDS